MPRIIWFSESRFEPLPVIRVCVQYFYPILPTRKAPAWRPLRTWVPDTQKQARITMCKLKLKKGEGASLLKSSSGDPHSAVEQVIVAIVSSACKSNGFASAETDKSYKEYGLEWKANNFIVILIVTRTTPTIHTMCRKYSRLYVH